MIKNDINLQKLRKQRDVASNGRAAIAKNFQLVTALKICEEV